MPDKKSLPPKIEIDGALRYRTAHPACIYCRSTAEPLSDEHIAPVSIGGNVIIEKGSCEICRAKTKAFEHTCAGEMFGSYRLSIGGPMRERRKWPSTVPIRIFDKSGNQDRI